MIDTLVASTPTRPHPFSTASDYTSWKSLTDKTYQGRQLLHPNENFRRTERRAPEGPYQGILFGSEIRTGVLCLQF